MFDALERAMCYREIFHIEKVNVANINPGDWIRWDGKWFLIRANDGATILTHRGTRLDIHNQSIAKGRFRHRAFSLFRTQLVLTILFSAAVSALVSWLSRHLS